MNSNEGSEPTPAKCPQSGFQQLPPCRDGQHPDHEMAEQFVRDVINSLFAVGLDLAGTSNMVEGVAVERLYRAIHALDDVIAVLRDDATEAARPSTVDWAAKPPSDSASG